MTKEKLIQYCDLQAEIKTLKKRIDKLQKQSDIVADVVQNGYKGRAVIRGYDIKRKQKLDRLADTIKIRYEKDLELQNEIESWINTIKEADIRDIFELRYIENLSWIKIQAIKKYKHEDTARKKHDRFLEKIF